MASDGHQMTTRREGNIPTPLQELIFSSEDKVLSCPPNSITIYIQKRTKGGRGEGGKEEREKLKGTGKKTERQTENKTERKGEKGGKQRVRGHRKHL